MSSVTFYKSLSTILVKAPKFLFDISHYIRLEQNKLYFSQVYTMPEYVLVLYI